MSGPVPQTAAAQPGEDHGSSLLNSLYGRSPGFTRAQNVRAWIYFFGNHVKDFQKCGLS